LVLIPTSQCFPIGLRKTHFLAPGASLVLWFYRVVAKANEPKTFNSFKSGLMMNEKKWRFIF
jgi:hypothetical protein